MNIKQGRIFQGVAVMAMLSMALLAGCERAEQAADPAADQARVDPPREDELSLGHVEEFDGFTIRANVSPTEFLPDSMAREYGVEADPNRFLLNVVVLQKRPDQRPVPVPAELIASYESLIGHVEVVEMRAVEASDLVSYIGALDTSAQNVFRFDIEARPEGSDRQLKMNFEVQIPNLDTD